eukprot:SRR837773.20305.p3 GENE.SRR837773.20305~~SRR837773.20305.p3  ORF type:complete len:185 (+),score=38.18 SRR837773.20305:200-754(+)
MYYNFFVPALAFFTHVVYWRTPWLTAGILSYWWCVCLLPALWLPSLPAALAAWFVMLRDTQIRNRLMTHPELLPLTAEGFQLVTARNNSAQVFVWVKRLVEDRCGWVSKPADLRLYVRTLYRAGKPAISFDQLLLELRCKDKSYINWQTGRAPKRCRCGAWLQMLGTGHLPRRPGEMAMFWSRR